MTTWHVLPVDDLIGHTNSEDCICGPEIEPLAHDGTIDWLVTHYSLDGRENHENDEAEETEEPRRDRLARWTPIVNFIFAIAFAWLAGAIWHPSSQILQWIPIAVSTAYLGWTITSYIHTRRNS